eukprot:TRINITY_DN11119_c0_g2_i1.p1 TRINITY_DN11119_c0_g2~~TRINITY_DN11119_c0_g2_i1.p1  ORF type:complete len:683 (-),score=95.01 TRINITY_DN11119_c0_g2_i1:177-2225(-)
MANRQRRMSMWTPDGNTNSIRGLFEKISTSHESNQVATTPHRQQNGRGRGRGRGAPRGRGGDPGRGRDAPRGRGRGGSVISNVNVPSLSVPANGASVNRTVSPRAAASAAERSTSPRLVSPRPVSPRTATPPPKSPVKQAPSSTSVTTTTTSLPPPRPKSMAPQALSPRNNSPATNGALSPRETSSPDTGIRPPGRPSSRPPLPTITTSSQAQTPPSRPVSMAPPPSSTADKRRSFAPSPSTSSAASPISPTALSASHRISVGPTAPLQPLVVPEVNTTLAPPVAEAPMTMIDPETGEEIVSKRRPVRRGTISMFQNPKISLYLPKGVGIDLSEEAAKEERRESNRSRATSTPPLIEADLVSKTSARSSPLSKGSPLAAAPTATPSVTPPKVKEVEEVIAAEDGDDEAYVAIDTKGDIEAKWKIRLEDLEMDELLSAGEAGEVYLGYMFGSPVAIKKLFISAAEVENVKKEYMLLKELHHPNVVQFIGLCLEKDIYIVTEFCPNGDLFDLLLFGGGDVSWGLRIQIALQMAEGMAYLHARGIMHRDLKGPNVLIGEDFTVKLCDLGLACVVEKKGGRRGTVCGTDQWMAPEIVMGLGYDDKVDMFSFGLVLTEIITKRPPPPRSIQEQLKFDEERFLASVPDDCPLEFSQLVLVCTKQDPKKRPSFKAILPGLRNLCKLYPA